MQRKMRAYHAVRHRLAKMAMGVLSVGTICPWGCGPVDPHARWRVFEARVSDDTTLRIESLSMKGVFGDIRYSSPIVSVIQKATTVECRLMKNPEMTEIAKIGADGKESRLPLTLVYEGSSIKEFRDQQEQSHSPREQPK